MDQQPQPAKEKEKDDKKSGLPTLRDTAQKPQFKIKGLKAGQSILERLKQFKKKDLAFILAGLGVLFMAPLAEHFLMSPDNGGSIGEGWNVKPGAGGLGSGGSPFEPGAGGVAPGDLAGGGSDVITPLNVRDPSALIMGPGATAQPPAMSSNAGQAPAQESSSWKDALAQSAAHAAGAATHAATPLPPLPQLSGGGLRGLGAVSGGGGASYTLPAISAGNVPNRGGGGGSLGLAKATNGYQGAAGARSLTNAGGGLEALKKAAGEAGSDFNRSSAGSGLEHAAATNMGSGSDFGGAGQGSAGMGQDKAAGQSSSKDSKSEGESLAFLAAKANQDHAIDLKWKLIEKQAMLWPDLKEKMVEELAMTPLKAFTNQISKMVENAVGGKGSTYHCFVTKDGTTPANPFHYEEIEKSDIANPVCPSTAGKDSSDAMWQPMGGNLFQQCFVSVPTQLICSEPNSGSDNGGGPRGASGLPGFVGADGVNTNNLNQLCTEFAKGANQTNSGSGGAGANAGKVQKDLLGVMENMGSVSAAVFSKDSIDPGKNCMGAHPLYSSINGDIYPSAVSIEQRKDGARKDLSAAEVDMQKLVDLSKTGVIAKIAGADDVAKGPLGQAVDAIRKTPTDPSPLTKLFGDEKTFLTASDNNATWTPAANALANLDEKVNANGGFQVQDNPNKLLRVKNNLDNMDKIMTLAEQKLEDADTALGNAATDNDTLADGTPEKGGNTRQITEASKQAGVLKEEIEQKKAELKNLRAEYGKAESALGDAETVFWQTENAVLSNPAPTAPAASIPQKSQAVAMPLQALADLAKSDPTGEFLKHVGAQQNDANADGFKPHAALKDSQSTVEKEIDGIMGSTGGSPQS